MSPTAKRDPRTNGLSPPNGRSTPRRELAVVPEHVVHPGLLGGWVVLKPPVQGGHRMKLHANAALSLRQRERMVSRVVELGWSLTQAAAAAGVSDRTCSKWVRRFRAEGPLGLLDRSSAPAVGANPTDEHAGQVIAALRRWGFP